MRLWRNKSWLISFSKWTAEKQGRVVHFSWSQYSTVSGKCLLNILRFQTTAGPFLCAEGPGKKHNISISDPLHSIFHWGLAYSFQLCVYELFIAVSLNKKSGIKTGKREKLSTKKRFWGPRINQARLKTQELLKDMFIFSLKEGTSKAVSITSMWKFQHNFTETTE